jgi:hypothetical protein
MSGGTIRTLDLHGLTWPEAQAAFVEFYNEALRRSGANASGRLDVVHGYGSSGTGGVLRTRLRGFLERQQTFLEYQAGESWDGNPGHTLVVPVKPLPVLAEGLEEEVWAYCATPRTLSKISGKFRRHGDSEVARAIKVLERQQRLSSVSKGAVKLFQAVSPG